MRRFALCLFMVFALAACGGGKVYKAPEHHHDKWQVDYDNCVWELTHAQQSDGTYVVKEIPEGQMDALAQQCMEKKGYTLEEKKSEGWFW
jgi:hypothetical protein